MRPAYINIFLALVCITSAPVWTAEVVFLQPGDALTDQYCIGLVKLALAESGGDYRVEYTGDNNSTLARRIANINNGSLSVLWTGTSRQLEETLTPIRVPVLKGLVGHRILLIRKGDQSRFDGVDSLEDLKRMTLGQGNQWADTPILEANGLQLVKNPKYLNLFFMLDGGRFDAFPRGIHEIWSEIERQREENGNSFVAEQRLMLVYRMPVYFFVAKDNEKLARDLERGLMTAISDGAFDAHFFNNPGVSGLLQKADIKHRKIFHLTNPNLPPDTPLDNRLLWLDIESL